MLLLDVRFSFLLRKTFTSKEGTHPIILRIIFRSQRRDVFTGLYCAAKFWDKALGRVYYQSKEAGGLNRNLEEMHRKAINVFDEFRFKADPFSIDELVDKIRGKEERPQTLVEFLEQANEKIRKRVGVEITKPTYYKYRKTLEYVQEYLLLEFRMKNYLVSRINVGFLDGYFRFLRNVRNISHNVALKYLSFLKVILAPAIKKGIIKDDPFRELKVKAKPTYREFLTEDEIQKLEKVSLEHPDLVRKRDIFLFACYTGLAYTDLKQLTRKHFVKEADGSYYILKPRQKTGQESIIPLLPAAERLLRRYTITNDMLDFHWQISSNQKMNLGLKYIGEKAGISKTLHMHLARHTFATTVTLSKGVPIETVSRMLGHANLRQTQHYAKVVATKIKDDMKKLRDLYK